MDQSVHQHTLVHKVHKTVTKSPHIALKVNGPKCMAISFTQVHKFTHLRSLVESNQHKLIKIRRAVGKSTCWVSEQSSPPEREREGGGGGQNKANDTLSALKISTFFFLSLLIFFFSLFNIPFSPVKSRHERNIPKVTYLHRKWA